MKVFKYELYPEAVHRVEMPVGATVLSVQMQGQYPCMWALVDPEEGHEVRHFVTCGTGHQLPPDIKAYVGTFQMPPLVFHVFEVTP